jgi:hypothetical protein
MSKIEEIKKIKKLLDEGLISIEEFDKLKIGIIDNKSENKSFQSNIDIIRKEIDEKKEILKERLEEKKCPNCNKIIYSKDLICNSCGLSNETPKAVEEKTEINTEAINNQENSNGNQNSNKRFYVIFGVVILLIFGVWFYIDAKNKRDLRETSNEKTTQDSISLVKSKDSIVEELKKHKAKSYQDSITLSNQQIDTASNKNNFLNENSNLIIGQNYEGGTIIYLDDSKKHGLLCSEIIITDRINTFEISQSQSKKYFSNNSGNWRLPSKSDFNYINLLIDLKGETFWTSSSGYVFDSSNNTVSHSRNNWQTSALIFVKEF